MTSNDTLRGKSNDSNWTRHRASCARRKLTLGLSLSSNFKNVKLVYNPMIKSERLNVASIRATVRIIVDIWHAAGHEFANRHLLCVLQRFHSKNGYRLLGSRGTRFNKHHR